MKIVILEKSSTEKIIEHFIAYGYNEFIIFSKIDVAYYTLNGISITQVNGFKVEGARDKLYKIKGSLEKRFCVVYSKSILNVEIECAESYHCSQQCISTIIEVDKRLCAIVCEPEIFDYMKMPNLLEKETLLKLAEDSELRIYK